VFLAINRFMFLLAIGAFMPLATFAQTPGQTAQEQVENIPVALGGYDVVTYFASPAPKEGLKTHQAVYGDKRYFFVSLENQEKFAANPEKYLPEFNEYCGCAASEGELVKADPKVYKVVNGRLVLFENNDALSLWNADENERYQRAQKFWKYEDRYDAEKRLRENTTVRLFTF